MQLPNGWKNLKLEEIACLKAGKFIPASQIKPQLDEVCIYPCFGGNGIRGYVPENSHKGLFPIIGRQGALCGNVNLATGRFYATEHAVVATSLNNNDSLWLYYALQFARLNQYATGQAQPGLSVDTINKIVFLVPPLAEQKKIAETLSVWDSAIEKMEKLIGAKQGCFNNLLNELIYCPAKDGKWKLAKLGEISEMGSGGTPKSSVEEYYNGDILWVSIADMTEQGMYISDTAKKLTKAGIENSSAKIYPAGTVLYAMYASIGEVSIASVDMSSSQAILGIQVGKNLRNKYLYYFLVGQKDRIKLQGQSGTQSNLNAGMVRNFDIPLPSLKKQDEIVELLDSSQKELSLLNQQLALYKKQKQGLMQKLLTGEWRV